MTYIVLNIGRQRGGAEGPGSGPGGRSGRHTRPPEESTGPGDTGRVACEHAPSQGRRTLRNCKNPTLFALDIYEISC
jgi:hypothetical protein